MLLSGVTGERLLEGVRIQTDPRVGIGKKTRQEKAPQTETFEGLFHALSLARADYVVVSIQSLGILLV